MSGVWWMTSPDLLSWSEPALLWQVPLLWRRDCAAPAAYAYPSLLDPASPARNFDSVGGAFWLYLVEMPLGPGCTRRARARPDPAAGQLAFAMTAGVSACTSAAGSASSAGPITGAS